FPEKCGRNVNLCDVGHDFIDQVESIVREMSGIERCSILYLHTVKSELCEVHVGKCGYQRTKKEPIGSLVIE
ncbi:hypothetical protein, partial [Vibrio parahaemolyticus]|uniref:hypothetical protein n=1 Tax=Vibrio parahaemolyticus TaxID=670 RepID=UPI001C601C61